MNWIVGAHHLKNLKALLTAGGHTVHIANDSLHKDASSGDLKNDMMVLVKKDSFLRAAKASIPSSFTVDAAILPTNGPSGELTQAVIRGLDSPAMGALSANDCQNLTATFEQEFTRQQLRDKSTWQIAFTLSDAGVVECRHNLELIERTDVPIAARDAFFAPGRIDRSFAPKFDTITDGPFKGFVRMTLQFLANVGGKIVKVTMVVFGPSVEVLKEMFGVLSANDPSMSVADRAAKAKSELKKRHGLSDEQLRIRLRREVGKTIIAERLGLPSEGLPSQSQGSWRS